MHLIIVFISSASHEWNRPEYGNTRNVKLSVTDPLNNDLESGNKRYLIHLQSCYFLIGSIKSLPQPEKIELHGHSRQ